MNESIRRRGPDGAGHLVHGPIALAMRRLAIIDIEGGKQPVFNEDRSAAVVFNGEIYNFRALRERLIAAGHRFHTHSDTEVLIHLYEEHGDDLVDHLQGMFAFAIWDFKKSRLLLARDRLGIKPLFIADTKQGLVFGSEIKAVLASGLVGSEMDWTAMDDYFSYTYIPAPRSIYREIRKVMPGTVVTVDASGKLTERRYWKVPEEQKQEHSTAEWVERIEKGLRESINLHLESDVPVGAFLSGGVDSGLLVALMAQAMDRPVETFTVGFTRAGTGFLDERVYARELAQKFGLNHHEIEVEPRVSDIIGEIVDAFDEPFADDSVVPSYYVSQIASRHVKVAMTGLGGDELFGGYKRHLGIKIGEYYSRVPRLIREALIDRMVRRLPEPKSSSDLVDHIKRFSRSSSGTSAHRYQDSLITLPASERWQLYSPETVAAIGDVPEAGLVETTFQGWRSGDALSRALKSDLAVYLVDDILTLTDRLSMWHSLELRVPYLHHPFVEDVMNIPSSLKIRGRTQKYVLREMAKKWLPESILNHRKQGFEAPMGAWLKGPLRELLESTLHSTRLRNDGVFQADVVAQLITEHVSGTRKHSKILFSLLMFHLWKDHAAKGMDMLSQPGFAAAG